MKTYPEQLILRGFFLAMLQAAIKSIKLAAKKGDNDSARILAKEVVNARKSVSKIYVAKANLSSVEMQIKQQVLIEKI
jgi:charged multivesicular body protein 3